MTNHQNTISKSIPIINNHSLNLEFAFLRCICILVLGSWFIAPLEGFVAAHRKLTLNMFDGLKDHRDDDQDTHPTE